MDYIGLINNLLVLFLLIGLAGELFKAEYQNWLDQQK